MTCDIPGAFMQADVDEVVHVRLSRSRRWTLDSTPSM
jgi:hypothetical protein